MNMSCKLYDERTDNELIFINRSQLLMLHFLYCTHYKDNTAPEAPDSKETMGQENRCEFVCVCFVPVISSPAPWRQIDHIPKDSSLH